jgi:mannose-6-phosphate isomerase-like protein (cupin superfamily)
MNDNESISTFAAVLAAGEGEALTVLGDRYVIKVGAAETGGLFTTLELTISPQRGPPPHVHQREDEMFYVLEGEFEFLLGGKTVRAGPGTFAYAPRRQVHTFKNVGLSPGRLLVTSTPGGMEIFFRRLGALPPDPPDLAKIIAIAKEHAIEIVMPRQ